MRNLIWVICVLVILSACANNGAQYNARQTLYENFIIEKELEELEKVTSFRFLGWNSLDNRHVVLSVSQNKSYLISLSSYCVDLDFTTQIVVDNFMSRVLTAKFDSIIIPSQPQQKCRISRIHKLDKDQVGEVTKLRKQLLKNKKDKQKEE